MVDSMGKGVGDFSSKSVQNEENKVKTKTIESNSGSSELTHSSVERLSDDLTHSTAIAGNSNESCINMLLNSEEYAFNNYYDLENLEEEFVPSEEFVNLE